VLTRAEDVRAVLQDSEAFSSRGITGFFRLLGKDWNLIPLELDPPEHGQYRALIEPQFTQKAVAALAPAMQERARGLIAAVRDAGGCEFVESFAQPFPVMVFLELFGLPLDDLDRCIAWAWGLLHGASMEQTAGAAQEMYAYLEQAMAEREGAPRLGLLSDIVQGKVNGRPLTFEEKMGYAFLIFIGGPDTVASSLGFYFRYLAENPDQQSRLRANPALIPVAVEELLREFGVVNAARTVVRDIEFAGVRMKAGDPILMPLGLSNIDPNGGSDGGIDFDRAQRPHLGFSTGKHRCIGANLARREIAIALELWTQSMPLLRLAPGPGPIAHGGSVFGVKELRLAWD
jgi:cytochrome P450